MLFRRDTGRILGVHIIGIHASDLIQVRRGACVRVRACVCAALVPPSPPTSSWAPSVWGRVAPQGT